MVTQAKIVFMGTPSFAVAPLEAIFRAKYAILGVITAPDRPVGRKQVLTPPEVKKTAQKLGLAVYQPTGKAEILGLVKKLKPDIIIVAAFGMLLPKEVLAIPKYGVLNIHASLLPRWRGASPIQASILAGDRETGVTIMLLNEKMDEGPILARQEFPISNFQFPKITVEELTKELSNLGSQLLVETLPKYLSGEIKPKPQDNSKATYCKIIKKEDGEIDWTKPAAEIERMTRAFLPWPSAYTHWKTNGGKTQALKILSAAVTDENGHITGEAFLNEEEKIAVKCGEKSIILETVQPEGKKPMPGKEFLKGHRGILASVLGLGSPKK